MADIFLSYAREDLPRARQVARALESTGWDVWWDRELRPGVNFRDEIERQLNEAACVLVLWSKASIASSFVKDEADHSLRRGVLVQALIEDVRPPFGFGQQNWADLSQWDADTASEDFAALCDGVAHHTPRKGDTGLPSPPPVPPPHPPLTLWLRRWWGWLAGGAVTAAAIATLLIWLPTPTPDPPARPSAATLQEIQDFIAENRDPEALATLATELAIAPNHPRLNELVGQLLKKAQDEVIRARTEAADAKGTGGFAAAVAEEQAATKLLGSNRVGGIRGLWSAARAFSNARPLPTADTAVALAEQLIGNRQDREALQVISVNHPKFPQESRFRPLLDRLLERAQAQLRTAKNSANPVRGSAGYIAAAAKEREAQVAGDRVKTIGLTWDAAALFDRAVADAGPVPEGPAVTIRNAQRLLNDGADAEALREILAGQQKYPAERTFDTMLSTLAARAEARLGTARTAAAVASKTPAYAAAAQSEQQASGAAPIARRIELMWEAARRYETAAAEAADGALTRAREAIRDGSDTDALRELADGKRAFPADRRFDELLKGVHNRAQSQAQAARDAVPGAARGSAAYKDATEKMTQATTKAAVDAIPLLWEAATAFRNVQVPAGGPSPTDIARKDIEVLLQRYVDAFRARDHVAVARLDPSRSADAWRKYFGNLRILDVGLDGTKTAIDGDSATVTFTRRIVATTLFGEKLTPRVPVTLNLRRSANAWGVASAKEGGS